MSEHELKANDPTPERGAIQYRNTFGVVYVFPDPVELELHEPIEGPVDTQGQRPVSLRENRLGARVAERLVGAAGAVESDPLDPTRQFHGAPPALKQFAVGLHRPRLAFTGQDPCARNVTGAGARRRQIVVPEPLLLAIVAYPRVFSAG